MKGKLPRMLRPMCNSYSCSLKAKGPPGQDLKNVVFREILSSIIKNALAQIKKKMHQFSYSFILEEWKNLLTFGIRKPVLSFTAASNCQI